MQKPKITPRDDSGTWELLESFQVQFSLDGLLYRITIDAGFACNLASVPRCAWALCGHPASFPRVCAAIPHDWLYACKFNRRFADRAYWAINRVYGRNAYVCAVEYLVLRRWGEKAWLADGGAEMERMRQLGKLEVYSTHTDSWNVLN